MMELVHRFTHEETAELAQLAGASIWVDGKGTARGAARDVKRCSIAELKLSARASALLEPMVHSETLRRFALPRRWTPFRAVRYRAGDHYGAHTDLAVTPGGFRCDFSLTVVLRCADAGGQFHTESCGRSSYRSEHPGEVWLYPSTTVHEVLPVESGERLVLVAWVESFVREHERRAVLAELEHIREELPQPHAERLRAVRQELLRQWA